MLAVTRNEGEEVIITHPDGTRIVVVFLRIVGHGKVRLGFDAPKEVTIHRREVQDEIDGLSSP